MRYDQAEYLMRLIKENYKDMNESDYKEIKDKIEGIAKNKIDDIFKRALNK